MLLPREVWRDIPGYEGLYQVSNIGNVRSLNYMRTSKIKRLKFFNDRNGYRFATLCKNGTKRHYAVHQLVALAFIPNPNNYPEVNHKDENKANNYVDNLEWCTRDYNMNYGTVKERISFKGKKVKCIELDKTFDSVREANEYLGKDKYSHNISMCARGRNKTAWKYHWEYVED